MTYATHALGGVAAGTMVLSMTGTDDKITTAAILSGAIIGSLLPDIDHTRSKISRSSAVTQVASFAVSAATKHRGFFHTPLFVLILAVALNTCIPLLPLNAVHETAQTISYGLIPGMLSHLLLDTCNPGGIMWLFPFSKKHYHVLSIKTSGLGEFVFSAVLIAFLALIYGIDVRSVLNDYI